MLVSPHIQAVILTVVAFLGAGFSAIAGLGGGTFLVAVMFVLGLPPPVAVPVHAAVQMVSNGSRTIAYGKFLDRRALLIFLAGAIVAPFFVAPLVSKADPDWIRLTMAGFLLFVTWAPWINRIHTKHWSGLVVAGLIAGGLGTVVGATGALIAPFFLREEWTKEGVIGNKAICQASAHVIKIAAFSAYGLQFWQHLHLVIPMTLAVITGTFLGKRLGGRLSEDKFKITFKVVLTLLAVKLVALVVWRWVWGVPN